MAQAATDLQHQARQLMEAIAYFKDGSSAPTVEITTRVAQAGTPLLTSASR